LPNEHHILKMYSSFKHINCSYYKCVCSVCPGTAKRMRDGSFVTIISHLESEAHGIGLNNNNNLIGIFRNVLKTRAKHEHIPLKVIYDDESQR